jgi:hypothetical protein
LDGIQSDVMAHSIFQGITLVSGWGAVKDNEAPSLPESGVQVMQDSLRGSEFVIRVGYKDGIDRCCWQVRVIGITHNRTDIVPSS